MKVCNVAFRIQTVYVILYVRISGDGDGGGDWIGSLGGIEPL